MSHPRFSSEEITRRGLPTDLYRSIRARVETEENIGKIISLDIETGDDPVKTARALQAKHNGAAIYGARIGYNAVFAVSGTLAWTP